MRGLEASGMLNLCLTRIAAPQQVRVEVSMGPADLGAGAWVGAACSCLIPSYAHSHSSSESSFLWDADFWTHARRRSATCTS